MRWPKISAVISPDQATATVTVSEAGAPLNLTQVKIPTWSALGGHDDLIWYTATKQADGSWAATIPITNHRTVGLYYADVYATASGTQRYVGGTTFTVNSLAAAHHIIAQNVDESAGTYNVTVVCDSPLGTYSLSVAVCRYQVKVAYIGTVRSILAIILGKQKIV